jgi:hypothetical protein
VPIRLFLQAILRLRRAATPHQRIAGHRKQAGR